MNEVPETLDFSKIYHGMMGRDFIVAFNGNFLKVDENLIYLLGEMIYRIKSSDIKEFRVENEVVQYTTDNETWHPVDITQWGNIQGSLADQTDLKEALDSKAALTTVTQLSSLVNAINRNLTSLQGVVDVANQNINTNTNNIVDILTTLESKVTSTTIKAIRLSENTFQWSPDGETWYQQEIVRSIPWGNLTGNWEDQSDIYQVITLLRRDLTTLQGTVSTLNSTLSTTVSGLAAAVQRLDTDEANIADLQTRVGDLETAVNNISTNFATKAEFNEHKNDQNNPHNVTAEQLGLENVDNTADIDKPISDPQQTYIQEYIANLLESMHLDNAVINNGNVSGLAITNENDYFENIDAYINSLVLVSNEIDDSYTVAKITLEGINNSVTDLNFTIANSIVDNKLVYTITNAYEQTNMQAALNNITLRIVKNNGVSVYENIDTSDILIKGQSKTIESSLPVAEANNIQFTDIVITYLPVENPMIDAYLSTTYGLTDYTNADSTERLNLRGITLAEIDEDGEIVEDDDGPVILLGTPNVKSNMVLFHFQTRNQINIHKNYKVLYHGASLNMPTNTVFRGADLSSTEEFNIAIDDIIREMLTPKLIIRDLDSTEYTLTCVDENDNEYTITYDSTNNYYVGDVESLHDLTITYEKDGDTYRATTNSKRYSITTINDDYNITIFDTDFTKVEGGND